MRNAAFHKSSRRSAVPCVALGAFFLAILLLHGFPLFTPVQAQTFQPEKFDKAILEDSLRDQEFLREQMLLDQEILREEMEQIRLEIQRIMKEITTAMKEEALKLKAELQGLQYETKGIQKELLGILENSKNDFIAGKEEMQAELQTMREEAKALTKDIKQVLEEQKDVWAQETAALKDSLVEAREEMALAQVDSGEALESTRSAFTDLKNDTDSTLAESQAASNAALSEAGNAFKKSQREYKEASRSVVAKLKLDMGDARETMQRKQKDQKLISKNTNQDILAALKTGKNKRLRELKRDSNKRKLQSKKRVRSSRKQVKKQKRVKNVEKRQARVRKSKVKVKDRKKTKQSIQRKSTQRKRPIKRPVAKKKIVKRPIAQEKEKPIIKPLIEKEIVANEGDVVVASLPDAAIKSSKETAQKKLTQFSKNITNLKTKIKNTRGNPGALLTELGDAYLEAQRFMDSKKDGMNRQELLNSPDNQDLFVGSFEQAAWAYKLALAFNHKSAETHLKIGKIYDEMQDGKNASCLQIWRTKSSKGTINQAKWKRHNLSLIN
jgi:hypothetical protein